jgi:endonuclease/exonuclease/phosphatase family metal-dependent hydrolase
MKILTFNMGHLAGDFRKVRRFLEQENPDLCFYQEGIGLFGWDSIKHISRGWEVRTVRMEKRWWGGWKLGILSKPPIYQTKEQELSSPYGDWRRVALGCWINGVTAVNVHLSSTQPDQKFEVPEVLAFMDRLPVSRIEIIAGDFNIPYYHEYCRPLFNAGFKVFGFDGADHIWIRGKQRDPLRDYFRVVLPDASDRRADGSYVHRGVLVEI